MEKFYLSPTACIVKNDSRSLHFVLISSKTSFKHDQLFALSLFIITKWTSEQNLMSYYDNTRFLTWKYVKDAFKIYWKSLKCKYIWEHFTIRFYLLTIFNALTNNEQNIVAVFINLC